MSDKRRMDAYYYSFYETGCDLVDKILGAVACAGNAYHHTDQWNEKGFLRDDHSGEAPVDWIQNAAQEAADRIEELEAKNKRLNEQMDSIEEMGTESLNALPDCLMRLAPALVENDELKAKLAKAVEALKAAAEQHRVVAGMDMMGASATAYNAARSAEATLAELKGETDE